MSDLDDLAKAAREHANRPKPPPIHYHQPHPPPPPLVIHHGNSFQNGFRSELGRGAARLTVLIICIAAAFVLGIIALIVCAGLIRLSAP